jgi:hypothetical protein
VELVLMAVVLARAELVVEEALVVEVDGSEVVLTVEDGVVDEVSVLGDTVELVVVLENADEVVELLVA